MQERSNLFESHWSNQWLTQNRVIPQRRKEDLLVFFAFFAPLRDTIFAALPATLPEIRHPKSEIRGTRHPKSKTPAPLARLLIH